MSSERSKFLMVNFLLRAKNQEQALKRARKKYKTMVITDVNWLQDSRLFKGEKLYQVVAHKRRVKKKK